MTADSEPRELVWEVRPWAQARLKGVLAILWIVLVSLAVLALAGPLLAALATVILAGSVGPFYVKTRYRLTPDGVEVQSPFQRLKRPWGGFRRMHVGKSGVSLNPYAKRHLLEPYRSVMLRFGDHRQAVLDWVRRYGPEEHA